MRTYAHLTDEELDSLVEATRERLTKMGAYDYEDVASEDPARRLFGKLSALCSEQDIRWEIVEID